jgi:hypothetical protein
MCKALSTVHSTCLLLNKWQPFFSFFTYPSAVAAFLTHVQKLPLPFMCSGIQIEISKILVFPVGGWPYPMGYVPVCPLFYFYPYPLPALSLSLKGRTVLIMHFISHHHPSHLLLGFLPCP